MVTKELPFSCSKVNGFSATCKQTSGFAPDYLSVEQTTLNRNRYRLYRVLVNFLSKTKEITRPYYSAKISLLEI